MPAPVLMFKSMNTLSTHELTHTPCLHFFYMGSWNLKKPCVFKCFYSIRSFTVFLCFVVGAFFAWPGSWRSANESLMDRMEQSKRGAWPPCPFIFPLPGLFECSDQDRLSGPNGGNSFWGGIVSLMLSSLTKRPFCDWVRIGQQGSSYRGKCKLGISRTNGPNLSLMLISVN